MEARLTGYVGVCRGGVECLPADQEMHPGTRKSSTPVLPDSDGHVRAFWLLVKSCVGAEVVPPYHFWLRAHPLLDINVLAMTRQFSVVLRCIYAEGVDLATLTSEQRAVPGPCRAEGAQGCCNSSGSGAKAGERQRGVDFRQNGAAEHCGKLRKDTTSHCFILRVGRSGRHWCPTGQEYGCCLHEPLRPQKGSTTRPSLAST